MSNALYRRLSRQVGAPPTPRSPISKETLATSLVTDIMTAAQYKEFNVKNYAHMRTLVGFCLDSPSAAKEYIPELDMDELNAAVTALAPIRARLLKAFEQKVNQSMGLKIYATVRSFRG
jgi:hypothetical protein